MCDRGKFEQRRRLIHLDRLFDRRARLILHLFKEKKVK